MIRFFETALKKNVRAVVQNVNHYVGRASSTHEPPPPLKKLDCDSHHDSHDSGRQDGDRSRSRYNGCHNWEAGCITGHPSFLVGTVLAAGIQLSKIASDVWFGYNESRLANDNKRKPSLLSKILVPPAHSRSVTFMRDDFDTKPKFKVVAGRKYDEGTITQDENLENILLASDAETSVMMNRKGASFAEQGNWKKAIEWFSAAANQGHAPAQYNLALYYHTVSRDADRARQLYSKAAEQGHKEAAYNLSLVLAQQQSPEWETAMSQAAKLGLVVAQDFLARYFFDNQHYSKSRLYYGMLRGNGGAVDDCSYWIGRCYEAEGNLLLADLWYQQSKLRNGRHGLNASIRSAKLGRCRFPRLMTESASTTLLMDENKSNTTHQSFHFTETASKPVFFIPSSEAESNCEDNGNFDSFALPSAMGVTRNGNIRRSQSAVQCST